MPRPLLVLALIVLSSSAALAGGDRATVLTRNVYLGADLTPVIAAASVEEFLVEADLALQHVAANDFPERAAALATEIRHTRPHLVGLQEVYSFTLNGGHGPPPFRDYLDDLLAAIGPPPFRDYLDDLLAAIGPRYEVAAVNENFRVAVPIPGLGTVALLDRDVILARADVPTEVVPVWLSGCTQSVDGCTYGLNAEASTPIGELARLRGFAVVDAWVGGEAYRFANTHLELRQPDPTNPLSPLVQAAQAQELLAVLDALPNPQGARVVIAGDLNSVPHDVPSLVQGIPIVPPYLQVLRAGYVDLWTRGAAHRRGRRGGTCCHAADLRNPLPTLDQRIDFLFVDREPKRVRVRRLGHRPRHRTPSGLWPSDHAGVVARLRFGDAFDWYRHR